MKKILWVFVLPILALMISVFTYQQLPESMVVQFNLGSEPRTIINKSIGAFLMPIIMVFTSLIMIVSVKFERNKNKQRRIESVIGPLLGIISILLLAVHGLIIAFNLGYEISIAVFATIAIGLVFILIGNLAPRLPQGSMDWPKLSERAHTRFSRFLGKLMVILGFIFILLALLPHQLIVPSMLILIAIFVIAVISQTTRYMRSH